jgi:hypothetical protein
MSGWLSGLIVPIKGLPGFYKPNDSLRCLGLREVPVLPNKAARTPEEIILLAFHAIAPEVFDTSS